VKSKKGVKEETINGERVLSLLLCLNGLSLRTWGREGYWGQENRESSGHTSVRKTCDFTGGESVGAAKGWIFLGRERINLMREKECGVKASGRPKKRIRHGTENKNSVWRGSREASPRGGSQEESEGKKWR